MSSSAAPGPEVIESGPESGHVGRRLRGFARLLAYRLLTWRVLLIVALILSSSAVVLLVDDYRERVAAEDRVSVVTGSDTAVSVDLATRTLLLDMSIDNRSPYAVTLDSLSVDTAGLAVEPGGAGTSRMPAKVPAQQVFETTLVLRPDCTNLPRLPAFRIVATTSSGRRHVVLLPPYKPLGQLWSMSVRSTCFDKPQ